MGAIEVMIEPLQGEESPELIRFELMTGQHRIPGMEKNFEPDFGQELQHASEDLGMCAPSGTVFLSKDILPDGRPKRCFEVGRGSFLSAVLQRANWEVRAAESAIAAEPAGLPARCCYRIASYTLRITTEFLR